MEQKNNINVAPPSAPAPAPKRSNTLLILMSIALVLALAVLGYLVWMTGVWKSLMQTQPQEEVAPPQTETSDIEADLQGVDLGGDAEIDALEAQI